MSAPRSESQTRPRPTQTFWPGTKQPSVAAQPARTADARVDEKRDEEPTEQEPGYGHGV